MSPARSRKAAPASFADVRAIGLALADVEQGTSYGTPALKRAGALFVRQHQDGESLVVKTDFDSRDVLLARDPQTFYITDHYRDYPWILVRLARVGPDDLRRLIEEAWRGAAKGRRPAAAVPRARAGRRRP